MLDINKALNEIIYRYYLDRHYPHYRNMQEAEKVVRELVSGIICDNRKAVFVGDNKVGIELVRNIAGAYQNIEFVLYERNINEFAQLETVDWEKAEKVYLISFYGAEYVERWFRRHHVQYEWIYDIFDREGLYLQREFFVFGKENLYSWVDPEGDCGARRGEETIQCELYCQQNKYASANDSRIKRIALEKCLFLELYMRNFVAAQKYILLLAEEDEQYQGLWGEILELLKSVKKEISCRKQQDIIIYWLDAVPFGAEGNMPYLQEAMRNSVVFENAFTNVPYTVPTLRSMFLGKRDIDDQGYQISEISKNNSKVIQFLETQGYDIKIFSDYFYGLFPVSYRKEHFCIDKYAPFSMKLWDMLSEMLLKEKKSLWLIHELESHAPYFVSSMNDKNCSCDQKGLEERYKLARMEVDEQLAFYDSFIHNGAFRIYMSDHGTGITIQNYVHILFNVRHRSLKPGKIESMYSILDFNKVLEQMIVDGRIKEDELSREYVPIGNMDRYNRQSVEKIFREKAGVSDGYFGYKGIIDKNYIYIHYTVGKEWLQKREKNRNPILLYDCSDDVYDESLLPKYRMLAGKYFDDLNRDGKFEYSKYLYALYHNLLKHNNLKEYVEIIQQMLEKYPDNSVAIRTGGYHSLKLYYLLSEESRKKIWGFIDNSDECRCSIFQMPITRNCLEEVLREIGIKAILLSSYINLEALRKEAESYPADIDILDIYDCFDKVGLHCDYEFWIVKGTKEDYEVGFPFDD